MRAPITVRSFLVLAVAGLLACSNPPDRPDDQPSALKVVSVTPADGATDVARETALTITFDATVDEPSLAAAFTVEPAVEGALKVEGKVATFTPAAPLAGKTAFTGKIAASAKNAAGGTLAAPFSWHFTTVEAPDVTPPGTPVLAKGEVSATTVELRWTAVGDDGMNGTAQAQSLRFARDAGCPLTAANLASATEVTGLAAPQAAGTAESFVVTGLEGDATYCFALQVTDDKGQSALSESLTVSTADVVAPGAPELTLVEAGAEAISLSWTAVHENGDAGGAVTAEELRFAQDAACDSWSSAEFAAGVAVTLANGPAAPGEAETAQAVNLASDHRYCFLLRVTDEAGNKAFSQLLDTRTADTVAPAPVADLSAAVLGTQVTIGWTATGDSNARGTAAKAELSYAPGACPDAAPLADATVVTLPAPQPAGTSESFVVTGLLPNAPYCFLLVVTDDVGLSSSSNLLPVTTGPLDPFAPSTAANLEATALSATSVRLRFAAPSDDAANPLSGPAAAYELRYLTGDACAIDDGSFDGGTAVSAASTLTPGAPGAGEELVVDGLTQETSYCFGLVALDETPNRSKVAAFPRVRTPDGTSPDAPALVLGNTVTDTSIELAWTTVGDDGMSGTVTTQQLYVSQDGCPATTDPALPGWTAVTTPAALEAGLPQSQLVSALANGTDYCFFLRVADEAGNTADSGTLRASTLDLLPPASPSVSASFANGEVTLAWTAVGDDGTSGAAAKYLLYSATTTTTCPADLTAGTARELARNDPAGTAETLVLPRLQAFSKYCFQLRAVDEAGNASLPSAVASVDTLQTDLQAPGAVTLTVGAVTSTGATLTFVAPANDGTDAASGPATAYDLRYVIANGAAQCAALDAAAFANAASLTTPAPAAPGTAEHLTVTLAPKDSGWCLALQSRDAVPNLSPISGWVYARDNTPPSAPALSATGLTATSVTVTFTAPGDDGNSGNAAGYVLAYRKATCPATAAAFDLASAAKVSGLAAPKAPGSTENLAISGLSRGGHYCVALQASDEAGNAAVSLLDVALPAPDTSAQIAAVRSAIHGATSSPITLPNLPVQGAIVTYVKAAVGTAVLGTPDGAGFFVQNRDTGPALFVALDPGTLQPGDVVDLVTQTATWAGCTATTCGPDDSMAVITAATVNRIDGGAALPAAQDLSAVALPLPIGTGPWAYEHERVTATGTIGAFSSGGSGFLKASFATAGTTSTNLVLRVPDTLPAALGLAAGCTVTVNGTPMWRNGVDAQFAGWVPADVTVVHCPPSLVSTRPADGAWLQNTSTVALTFSAPMDPATLTVQSSAGACTGAIQLSADPGFANCVGLSVAVSGSTVTLTPVPGLADGQRYRVRVTGPAASTDGAAIPAGSYLTTPLGFATSSDAATCTSNQVVISQVYGGGGNSGAYYKNDFIELHNRGTSQVSVAGWSVQYGSTNGTSWAVTSLTGTIAPGGYYLVQGGAGTSGGTALPTVDAPGSMNLSATAGKVALVSNTTALSGACPTSASIVDLVGFGGANCSRGTSTIAPSNTNAIVRLGNGCVDHGANYADFVPAPATPHNSTSAVNGCGCTGVTGAVVNGTGTAGEADLCQLVTPATISVASGQATATVSGRLTEAGVTPTASGATAVRAELGLGPAGSNPFVGWSYFPASFNAQCTGCGSADEYQRTLTAPTVTGNYSYTWRFSLDSGAHWTYCDLDGAGSGTGLTFDRTKLGAMTVTP